MREIGPVDPAVPRFPCQTHDPVRRPSYSLPHFKPLDPLQSSCTLSLDQTLSDFERAAA
ncbi:hypothetical protein KSP40_PGU015929 [Platanthera guangdongensis]|uniref:Uncharacterized protein n=1 Tax=Platanthera guangdongensis TaxID=2320717 RepID=A0ABR2LI33_9ASPA